MAQEQTYTLAMANLNLATAQILLGIGNIDATYAIMPRIRRVGLMNKQTVATTGQIDTILIERKTGGVYVPIFSYVANVAKHDTRNGDIDDYVICGNMGAAGPGTDNLRTIIWSSDEPTVANATLDGLECLVPLNIVWDAGYGQDDVGGIGSTQFMPLTLNYEETFCLRRSATVGAARNIDIWCEFTLTSSPMIYG